MSLSRRAFCGYTAAGVLDRAFNVSVTALASTPREEVPKKDGTSPIIKGFSAEQPKSVDTHSFLLVDVSPSVDREEYKMIMTGLKDSLLSSATLAQNLKEGVRYGISVIFFDHAPVYGGTHYVATQEDLLDFVNTHFWDSDANAPRSRPISSFGTYIASAIRHMGRVIEREKEIGLQPARRTAIIIGDGPDNNFLSPMLRKSAIESSVRKASLEVSRKHCVSISAVPIVLRGQGGDVEAAFSLPAYFKAQVITPPDITCDAVFGNASYKVSVDVGKVFPAEGFSGIRKSVQLALGAAKF